MPAPILSIVGKSKSGKTTLMEKIIAELKRKGYHVATVKHHSHPGFDIDVPGKDTWRHAKAGSDHVVIAAPDKIASIRRLEHELTLDEIAREITGVDIILTEGFKRAGKPSLEVIREERGTEFVSDPDQLAAIASEIPIEAPVPVFDWNDIQNLVEFIEMEFIRPEHPHKP